MQRPPISSIVVTGRTAVSVGRRGHGEFLWMTKPGSNLLRLSNGKETKPSDFYEFDPAHMLPPGVFSCLTGGYVATNSSWANDGLLVRTYRSGKDADKDLNRAALVWAKAEGRMAA